jgi:hypothetical protein
MLLVLPGRTGLYLRLLAQVRRQYVDGARTGHLHPRDIVERRVLVLLEVSG